MTPEEGNGTGEADLSQIEIGIAAAIYGDPDLIKMFNSSDVYSAMVRQYYATELPAEAQYLPEHNRRFAQEAARAENYHVRAPSVAKLRAVFRLETERWISNDWVVQ